MLKVFVALYKEGLIYKDKRLVNWDPKLLTAISDLEVEQVERSSGNLWHIRYPLDGMTDPFEHSSPSRRRGPRRCWATPRWRCIRRRALPHLIGKNVILPLVGRQIPIVADDIRRPEKGSGAVKITPAHDFNDFEVGKRHKRLPTSSTSSTPKAASAFEDNYRSFPRQLGRYLPTQASDDDALHGVDRFAARKKIVERLEAGGLLDKVEPHTHMVPHGDRSGVVIEPFLTDQWYVNAKELAKPAIDAVRSESYARFIPKNWEKTYFDWMENIQPWCISRQLWWGHQIPAWYGVCRTRQVLLASIFRDRGRGAGRRRRLIKPSQVKVVASAPATDGAA